MTPRSLRNLRSIHGRAPTARLAASRSVSVAGLFAARRASSEQPGQSDSRRAVSTRGSLGLVAVLTLSLWIPTGAAAAESPAELVRSEVAQVLAIVKDESISPEARRAQLTRRIAARFDFESMAQSILATHWKKASADEREAFIDLFKLLLEQTYVSAIERHTTETVRVGGERYRNGNATVIVTIEREDHTDVPLLFKLKPDGDGWMVYDANVEGLSLVSHYRDTLGAIAAREEMPGVLAYLEAKTSAGG